MERILEHLKDNKSRIWTQYSKSKFQSRLTGVATRDAKLGTVIGSVEIKFKANALFFADTLILL